LRLSHQQNGFSHTPLVTVVVPLFNKVETVYRSIASVCNQTYERLEILVVDDGSEDHSVEEVKRIRDRRIRIITQINQGQSAARNRGIELASGRFIAFLDADDTWDSNHLELLMSLAEKFPDAGLFASAYRTKNRSGRYTELTVRTHEEGRNGVVLPDYFRLAARAPVVWVGAIMVPKRVFDDVGDFMVGEHRGGDREMWARIASAHSVAYVPTVSVTYDCAAVGRESTKLRKLQWPPLVKLLDEAIKQIGARQQKQLRQMRQYRNKALFGYVSRAIVNRDKATALCALREVEFLDCQSISYAIWLRLLILSPVGIARLIFRLAGSRVFFLVKRVWLRLHGVDFRLVRSN